MSVTNYELHPYKLRACRYVTLLKQIVEEKWKRNNPLPPLRLPLYKGVSKDLVEVEAKMDKKIWEDYYLMRLADKRIRKNLVKSNFLRKYLAV